MGKRKTAEEVGEVMEEERTEEVQAAAPALATYKRSIANFDKKPYIQLEGYPTLKERDVLKMYDEAVIALHKKLFGVEVGAQAAREAVIKLIMGE